MIHDDYLSPESYEELTSTHLEYGKVHWIGKNSSPANALHELVHSTYKYLSRPALGATAWYNIRPIQPKWHNDIDSYCTQNGVTKWPELLPELTFLYYVHSPKSGGNLQVESEEYEPIANRLLYFDALLVHRIAPYEGNRVSIGMVWWPEIPFPYDTFRWTEPYGTLSMSETTVLPRIWEIEDG